MKKVFLTMALIAGVLAGAMTLSAFSKSEPKNDSNTIMTTEEMADNCSFDVTDVTPSISGTTVTLKVRIVPTFAPDKRGRYTVVVKPNGSLRNILDSQSKSVSFWYTGSEWDDKYEVVNFYCDVNDNTYRQCSTQSFSTSCFREQ